MKATIALLLSVSMTAADESYDTNYEVSRSNSNVQYVYQISAQGSHGPSKILGLAKNPDEEAQYAGYITPLGVRQQYMIGNELRYRYVEEMKGKYLEDLYDITQVLIQTNWNDTSILSAQAMLLGLYPPGKNNYKITEEQKYNAVPPVEGFDFKPWIDEMGLEALPYQTTVFPIQMNGWSYDYMLALDDENCPARGSQRQSIAAQLDQTAKNIATQQLPEIQQFFDKYGWKDFCDYITWAYIESVDLNLNPALDEEKRFAACQEIQKNQTKEFHQLDKNDVIKTASTNEIRKNLQEQITFWLNLNTTSHQNLAESDKKPKSGKSLEGTAGSENPKYVMFWTSEETLSLIAQSISKSTQLDKLLPLSPSSTIIFEFTKPANGGDLDVQTFINDQLVDTFDCDYQSACKAKGFADGLEADIQKKAVNITTFCAPLPSKDGTHKVL